MDSNTKRFEVVVEVVRLMRVTVDTVESATQAEMEVRARWASRYRETATPVMGHEHARVTSVVEAPRAARVLTMTPRRPIAPRTVEGNAIA